MNVWVTRDEDSGGSLSAALSAEGLTPVLEPVVMRRLIDNAAGAIAALGPNDWLVLTSVFAVQSVPQDPARVPRVAVIGEESGRVARSRGFRVELISPRHGAKSLFDALEQVAQRGRILYPRSSRATQPRAWPGVELQSPVMYETTRRDFDQGVVDRVDVVSVASPSAVEAVGAVDRPFASIGPTTSAAIRALGVSPRIEAPKRSFRSLAQAIAAYADDSRHQRA